MLPREAPRGGQGPAVLRRRSGKFLDRRHGGRVAGGHRNVSDRAEKVEFGMGKIKDMGFCIAYANLYLKLIRRQEALQRVEPFPEVGSTWLNAGEGGETEQVDEKRKLMFQLRGILQYWRRSLDEMGTGRERNVRPTNVKH